MKNKETIEKKIRELEKDTADRLVRIGKTSYVTVEVTKKMVDQISINNTVVDWLAWVLQD